MKKTILLFLLAFIGLSTANAQVGIGTQTPAPSSILDLTATNKGFLPPRLSTAQRDLITSPATGLTIYNTDNKCLEFWNATVWISACDGSVVSCQNDISVGTGAIVQMMYPYSGAYNTFNYSWCAREVTAAGYTWLDRNLGAYRVATASNDAQSYGDLFQWGRTNDGHAKRVQRSGQLAEEGNATQGVMVNGTTSTNADVPVDALFITEGTAPTDWRVNPDNALWNGVGAVNNPCPTGYRVPNSTELQALDNSFSPNTSAGAFSSAVKMPVPGFRDDSDGILYTVGSNGIYWSSAVSGSFASYLIVSSSGNFMFTDYRAAGLSVRCLKD